MKFSKLLHYRALVTAVLRTGTRLYCQGPAEKCSNIMKVTVCGAAGQVGQPLSLMIKQCPYVDELALYDLVGMCGMGMELSHVDTKCKVKAYTGKERIADSLNNAKVVIICAGTSRKPCMTREDLFGCNAPVAVDIASACARYCPNALIGVVTSPVNSMVPIVSEIMKRYGKWNPNKIFGITTLDCVRANMFVAEVLGMAPECVVVPVIGGHSDCTIIPLLSQAQPCNDFKQEEVTKITQAVQQAGAVVVKAKDGGGSATLSTAFATARFTISLVKGLLGQKGVVECSYIYSPCIKDVEYFATPLELGPCGVMANYGIPQLCDQECQLLQQAIPVLQNDICQGEMYVKNLCSSPCPCC